MGVNQALQHYTWKVFLIQQ